MVIGTDVCDLPDWVPVPTNDSTISIINLVVAGSNLPFGILRFLATLPSSLLPLKHPPFKGLPTFSYAASPHQTA